MTTATVPRAPSSATSSGTLDARASWVLAAGATVVLGVVLGVFGSVGMLLDPLAAEYGAARSDLVLLFAAALSVHSLAARGAGRAMDRWGPRPLLSIAAAGMGVGLLTPAVAGATWVAVAGYGLGLGLASACTWVATTAAVSAAFDRRRAAALGLLTAGPAIGGVVLAPTMTALCEARGPRFTCAVLAVVGTGTCISGAALIRRRRGDRHAATNDGSPVPRELLLFHAAGLLMSLVVFLPLVHLPGSAVDLGLPPAQAAALFAIISAVSATTRIGAGWLAAPRTLPRLHLAGHVLVAAAFVVWALAGPPMALPLLIAVAVLFGAGYGMWLSLGPAMLALTTDPRRLGRALGTYSTAVGIGGVIGPVLAAPLLVATPTLLLGTCVIVVLVAAVLLVCHRTASRPGHSPASISRRPRRTDIPTGTPAWPRDRSQHRPRSQRTAGASAGSAASQACQPGVSCSTNDLASWPNRYPPSRIEQVPSPVGQE